MNQSTANGSAAQHFYLFLGTHSLLIGLLPFFLPVYLWQHGLDLVGLSILIGASGLSFAASLSLWQYLACRWKLKRLISLTFTFELLLVAIVGLLTTVPGAALYTETHAEPAIPVMNLCLAAIGIGMANGLYNAFFWTTQRTLFLRQLGSNNAGRQYGNFQIFVTLVLKVGILLGGLLLENGGFIWVLALSAGIGLTSNHYLNKQATAQQKLFRHVPASPVTLRSSISYQDQHGSRPTFIVDGLFLYLESHFWTLSLFLVVREDFNRLGIAVVILAIAFAALFYLIKNRIDQLAVDHVYRAAVWLYAGSWLLRLTLSEQSNGPSLWAALILITFCSSFFRLSFNKRFFDIARQSGNVRYLLFKSYSSQLWLGIGFSTLGLALLVTSLPHDQALRYLYVPAALLTAYYLRYSTKD